MTKQQLYHGDSVSIAGMGKVNIIETSPSLNGLLRYIW